MALLTADALASAHAPASVERAPLVAYFSMEIGLESRVPTYSGGLGVLAGDTLRAAADLGIPMVGVTLLYRKGYFRQHLDGAGGQSESPAAWVPEAMLEPLSVRVTVSVEGRPVVVRAWRYCIMGIAGHCVPVYLLDTDLEENSPQDRRLTDWLYGGDARYRLSQEVVLGLGGAAMVRSLSTGAPQVFHMNEGHAALLTLGLLKERTGSRLGSARPEDLEAIAHRLVFTTHTPVPAGMDRFSLDLAESVVGGEEARALQRVDCCFAGDLNMTYVALASARYVNGVALRHGEVSRDLFPSYRINAITNGVHAATWTAGPLARLFDARLPGWRRDNNYLRYAVGISLDEIRTAHAEAKAELVAEVRRRTGVALDAAVFTLGFARRAASYKRADLLFTDLERLRRIAREAGPIQVVYAGKAHPHDEGGKAMIRRVHEAAAALGDAVRVVYLEDYDMDLAKILCAGVDVWLNTPQKPLEASGTSGMKAALNGVPSLSVLDGWWVEGCVEGVTGWSIGDRSSESDVPAEIASLYDKLERAVLPLFYSRPDGFAEVMRSAISLNGSFFNAQRMMSQYLSNAYMNDE